MKAVKPNTLARTLVKFFQEYLPTLRGMSSHTIRSCRDSLYLRFVSTRKRCRIEALDIEHFSTDIVDTRRPFISWKPVAFLSKAGDAATRNSAELQAPASPYTVMAGTIIPAALVTGMNSDLPGQVIATVT